MTCSFAMTDSLDSSRNGVERVMEKKNVAEWVETKTK